MIKNVFENKYAECLVLRDASEGSGEKGEAVGLALVSDPQEVTPLLYLTALFE